MHIPISFNNIQRGLNAGVHMTLICPTKPETDRLWRNARELYYIKGFTQFKGTERSIEYGITLDHPISIRFKNLSSFASQSWRGFRGVFLIHPEIYPENIIAREERELREMLQHNTRYADKWQD